MPVVAGELDEGRGGGAFECDKQKYFRPTRSPGMMIMQHLSAVVPGSGMPTVVRFGIQRRPHWDPRLLKWSQTRHPHPGRCAALPRYI